MPTLKKLLSLPEFNSIHLAAGYDGINRQVTGINVTESDALIEFYRKNELIVTTGIHTVNTPHKLIDMVKAAFRRQSSGIVLNVGPYIPVIPKEILLFAEKHHFPVFEMPWEYRVADFVKISIQFLTSEEQKQRKTEHILSHILFNPQTNDNYIAKEILQIGITPSTDLSILVCTEITDQIIPPPLIYIIETILSKKYDLLIPITKKNQLIFLVNGTHVRLPNVRLSSLVTEIKKNYQEKAPQSNLFIGMGNFYQDIQDLVRSYQEAQIMINITQHHPDYLICDYKNIGAYKLIMDIKNRSALENFHDDSIKALQNYDALHETNFVRFLRIFLEADGRTAIISKKEFIHRNTVLYKIKKIESILGIDLDDPYVKTNLLLAYMIKDILN